MTGQGALVSGLQLYPPLDAATEAALTTGLAGVLFDNGAGLVGNPAREAGS